MDTKKFKETCQNESVMVNKLSKPRKLMELSNLLSTIRDKDFNKVSKAADGLKQYVEALLGYVQIFRNVKPKMDQQEKASKELNKVEAKLEDKIKSLNEKD